MAVFKFSFLD